MNRLCVALLLVALPAARAAATGVAGSKHDLSITGPGPIRALSENDPCIFCHVSHFASGGKLSNRPDSKATYTPYASSTMQATVAAPTGASKICLSCHDGTIAVGKTYTRDIAMTSNLVQGSANLGTDLRRTHPVSFVPRTGGTTHNPAAGDAVKLDAAGQLQCTSCHDPHRQWDGDPVQGKFLVKSNRNSLICLTCHDAASVAPASSSHAASPASFGTAQGNTGSFTSVREAGCAACHGSHAGQVDGRLVRKSAGDDDSACLSCHASAVTRVNFTADAAKPYGHFGIGKGVHDEAESPGGKPALPENAGATRHATCVDCHDPHSASGGASPTPPAAGPLLTGMWGVNDLGLKVDPAQYEWQVCVKCHGSSANQTASLNLPQRAARDLNLVRVFSSSSPSFHPVMSAGKNADVPGLLLSYTAGSIIGCTSCHTSNSSPAAGGTGPRGPHGSNYQFLLGWNYATTDYTGESTSSYALCYRCHSRDVLFADVTTGTGTGFRKNNGTGTAVSEHRLHVQLRSIPCSACHSAHGVSSFAGGTATANAHLIDFDTGIVSANPVTKVRAYQSAGTRAGSCNLSCHASNHDGSATYSYP